jgi:hypothetical protein
MPYPPAYFTVSLLPGLTRYEPFLRDDRRLAGTIVCQLIQCTAGVVRSHAGAAFDYRLNGKNMAHLLGAKDIMFV